MFRFNRSTALAAALLVAACSSGQSDTGDVGPSNPDMNMGDADRPMWTAEIEATTSNGHGGNASVWLEGNGTVVRVTLNRGASGGVHPWHIHEGRCGSGGGVVGSAGAYPILDVGTDNRVTATARIGVPLDHGGQYYVNIHQSRDAMGTIVGCGNLVMRM